MSLASKIQSLLTAANAKTGGTAADLTEAVQALCDGYGQGGGETPTINGMAFDCGTFSFETDQTERFDIPHSLGVAPSAAFIWISDPPLTDADGNDLRYQYAKIRTVSGTTNRKVGAMLYVSGGEYSAIKSSTYEAGHFGWDESVLTVYCSSSLPILAGLTYNWLAIGGAV